MGQYFIMAKFHPLLMIVINKLELVSDKLVNVKLRLPCRMCAVDEFTHLHLASLVLLVNSLLLLDSDRADVCK